MAALPSYPASIAQLVGEVDAGEEVRANSRERLDLSFYFVLSHQVHLQQDTTRMQHNETQENNHHQVRCLQTFHNPLSPRSHACPRRRPPTLTPPTPDLFLPGRLAGEVGSPEEAVELAFISLGEWDQHVLRDS